MQCTLIENFIEDFISFNVIGVDFTSSWSGVQSLGCYVSLLSQFFSFLVFSVILLVA